METKENIQGWMDYFYSINPDLMPLIFGAVVFFLFLAVISVDYINMMMHNRMGGDKALQRKIDAAILDKQLKDAWKGDGGV